MEQLAILPDFIFYISGSIQNKENIVVYMLFKYLQTESVGHINASSYMHKKAIAMT